MSIFQSLLARMDVLAGMCRCERITLTNHESDRLEAHIRALGSVFVTRVCREDRPDERVQVFKRPSSPFGNAVMKLEISRTGSSSFLSRSAVPR